MYIIHSVNKEEFENEIKFGKYGSLSIKKYGFIHCSDLDTYYLVAPNFRKDYSEIIILLIDTDKVEHEIKQEDVGGKDFLHIYGLLDRNAIVGIFLYLWSDDITLIPNEELMLYAPD